MHYSVLLNESIEGLNIKEDGKYIDGTLGYAGHSSKILERIKERGFLFAFDQDIEAIKYSEEKLSKISNNFKIFHTNFKNMKECINENVDGIIFDLGVSSPQLDDETRGFSYHKDARLDMRMDQSQRLRAYEVVNEYPYEKLVEIFFTYGEEAHSKSIAKKIVDTRSIKPIETTLELAEIIKSSVPISYRNEKHPARKVFQAIRIEVNGELAILEGAIKDAFDLLKPKGRMCVITFHSLEDKIIKKVFKELSSEDAAARHLPVVPDYMKAKAVLISKNAINPSEEELAENNRSRSAKLRIIEKL